MDNKTFLEELKKLDAERGERIKSLRENLDNLWGNDDEEWKD